MITGGPRHREPLYLDGSFNLLAIALSGPALLEIRIERDKYRPIGVAHLLQVPQGHF